MKLCQILIISLLLIVMLPLSICSAAVSVQFVAGVPTGWDFYGLESDIQRNNTVDYNDLALLAQHWLQEGCGDADQWCGNADIDESSGVNFIDYTLMAKDWSRQAGENVLLQTIYGTAQDSGGNITANAYRALSIDKGMAMAFAVPGNTVLDKCIFKCYGVKTSNNIRIRLFNVTGKGYLSYLHTMTKADPGAGSTAIVDQTITSPSSVPYHSELGDGRKYTDMIINFGLLEVTTGEYLIVFDGIGPDNTPVTMVKGNQAGAASMGSYPDGSPLPKRATVTTGSTSIGNTYYYQLENTSATSYAAASNLFAFQILTTVINHAPAVDAGANQSITAPNNTAALDGTVSDDGLPNPPGAVTTLWTKQSGPGTVIFGDAGAVDTTATFSDYGTYVLRLTANDGEFSVYDEVTIDYSSGNQAPVVDAGANATITYPVNSVGLDATVTDDGKPTPPGVVTTLWTKQSGPGTVVFGDAATVDTTATFSDFGTYVLRLTANDGELSSYDEVTITYLESPAQNQAPVVNAGIDMQIALTGSAILDGTVTDDGLPNPPHAVTTLWTKHSGPAGTVTFGSASSIDTTASFSVVGTYVLRLTANDSELSSYDEVTITVNNETPVQTAELQWDGGLNHQMVGNEISNGRWEDANNWYCALTPSRDRTIPILGDTVKIHFYVTNDPPNPNSPNFNPQSHITIDTVGIAKAGKVQAKEYTNSLTVLAGADLETKGNIEWYQDWTFNVHDLIIYGTLNACTNVGQVRIGGHQSFSYNNMYVYGVVNILGATGGSALWMGYAVSDNTGSYDHNRLYIYSTGIITTDDLLMKGSDAVMDIQSGGKLVVKGNEKSEIDVYVSESRIAGDGVIGNVTVTYYADSDETVIQPAGVPQVNAGGDVQIINPVNSAALNGTVVPDGLTTQWTKLSGPGTVVFDDASQINTTATFSAYGTYVLRLEATDNGQTGYDYVTIAYLETQPPQNQAPVVNAGIDQQIELGSNATLDGTVNDDGLPNPPGAVTTTWTMQSGPGTVTFSNTNAVDTTASFSAAGTYVLRLTASDSVLTSYDELTIVVSGTPPLPPVTQWYRIGLHFHSTNSDGAETPETMYTRYRDMGLYAGACMTDHDYITDGSTWNSSSYLAINGAEVTNGKSHVNAFGATETPGTLSSPGATLQEHITRAIAAGGLPIVNHPKWTMEYTDQKVTDLPQQIINSTGCKLFEIFNYYCEDYWGWGFSETIYDQVLTAGKQIYCVAGDDAHGLGRAGFTSNYVGATELTLSAIKDAMDKGNFYCCRSTTKWDSGIKLTDYQVSGKDAGDTISITADVNAQKIEFIGNNGSILKTVNSSSGSYTIAGTEKYVRARITNTSGDYTWTQPVFVSGGGPPPGPVRIDDYQGYGTPTTGGKDGTDILVTSLADSGTGTLRAALAQANGVNKYMIKFQVGGCITLATPLTAKSFVTIAGETAPSPGITLLDGGSYRGLEIDCQNFIIRHIRFRNFTGEGIQIWGGHDNVIDRCSVTGTGDGAIDMNTGGHFIISRCLFGGCTEVHKAHCTYVSAHHSLYAWNNRRQPRIFEGGPYWDFRNNYVEYWTNSGANILSSTAVNIVNNYWGPPSPEAGWSAAIVITGTTDPNTVYTNGNYCSGFNVDGAGLKPTPNIEPNVTTIPATDVPANVLADCGAQPTDAIDQYYINGGGLNPPAVNCAGGGESGGGGGGLAWSETADYYVDGTTGSDSNPGTSASPWQTLTNAVTNATSGKKVLVWGGQTYSGALTFGNSGTSASPITFKRDPASNIAIIDGAGTTSGTLYTTKAKYIVLDGFTIQNGKYGIYTYGATVSDWTIKNCRVTNNSMYGIYLRSGTGFSLFNDAVYLNAATTTGIYFFNSATNNNVAQCSVYNQKYGIHYDTSASGTVTNSIVANNTIYGIWNRSSTVTITYSDVWSNGTNYSGCSAGTGCISADPKWIDPDAGDFHLGTGSPCDNTASDGGDMGYRYSASAL